MCATYEARKRKAVSESGHRSLEVAGMEILVDVLPFHGGVHVRPDKRDGTAGNASTLVGDLDSYVLFPLNDNDLDRRKLIFLVGTEPLDDRA